MTELAHGRQRFIGFALWAFRLPKRGATLKPERVMREWRVDRATAYRWLGDYLTVTTGEPMKKRAYAAPKPPRARKARPTPPKPKPARAHPWNRRAA